MKPIRYSLTAVVMVALIALAGHTVHAAAATGKLVITKAVYGDLPSGASTDVTKKVAEMVKDNVLSVEASNDNFGDPAEGVFKKLRVEYTKDSVAGVKTVDENETLKLDPNEKIRLVITKAVYGDLPGGTSTDVTKKVAEMVKDNALSVEASNDNFGDPAEGIGKKLRVEYTLDGVARGKTVAENETLKIDPSAKVRLVIRKAVYGDLPDGPKTDVTQKVAELVNDNALSVAASNDNFGDPIEGTEKKLRVDYTFDGVEKSKTIAENETLTISTTGE